MADKNNKKKGRGSDEEPRPDPKVDGSDSADAAAEELIEAEGPDIETSFDDADLEFLDKSAGDLAAERLADLQRLQAEYANYRKRVERDREANRIMAVADAVSSLLPILDDLDLADNHGDLEEGTPFSIIAQKLRATLERVGLERVGEKGDEFDHNVHEAIAQIPSDDVTVMTVLDVAKVGYKLSDRLLRPAQVAVATPTED